MSFTVMYKYKPKLAHKKSVNSYNLSLKRIKRMEEEVLTRDSKAAENPERKFFSGLPAGVNSVNRA